MSATAFRRALHFFSRFPESTVSFLLFPFSHNWIRRIYYSEGLLGQLYYFRSLLFPYSCHSSCPYPSCPFVYCSIIIVRTIFCPPHHWLSSYYYSYSLYFSIPVCCFATVLFPFFFSFLSSSSFSDSLATFNCPICHIAYCSAFFLVSSYPIRTYINYIE